MIFTLKAKIVNKSGVIIGYRLIDAYGSFYDVTRYSVIHVSYNISNATVSGGYLRCKDNTTRTLPKIMVENEKDIPRMERLKNTTLIQKANFYYNFKGKNYKIGTITREFLNDRLITAFVMDLDKKVIDELAKQDKTINATFVPGIDFDLDGYYIASSRLPYIVEKRVIDRRRDDLQKYLDMFHMETYDAFTMFLRSNGRGMDGFWVEEVPVE